MSKYHDLETLLKKGVALHRNGKLQDAATVYHIVLAINPQYFAALQLLATAYAELANNSIAAVLFERAIQVDASHPEVF